VTSRRGTFVSVMAQPEERKRGGGRLGGHRRKRMGGGDCLWTQIKRKADCSPFTEKGEGEGRLTGKSLHKKEGKKGGVVWV